MTAGEPQLDRDGEVAVLRAVENTIWGLGRLQQLLDLPDVEDIHIVGAERPLLRMVDGSVRRAPEPVADSDADLIAQLQYVAAHHAGAERAFSPAQPCLNMQLPDGSRLAAMRDVVAAPDGDDPPPPPARCPPGRPGPARHARSPGGPVPHRPGRRRGATCWSPGCRRAGRRRCCARWPGRSPPGERVATLETEYELGLHRLPGGSPLLVALETRPGSTEVDPATGARAGQITLSDLLHQTLRMSVTRVIVGEVRGAEALPMLEAMNAGMPGSMCTLHAGSAADAMERLVTAALKAAGGGWSDTFVTRLAAQGIDYVVHLRHLDPPPPPPGTTAPAGPGRPGGRRSGSGGRFVAEIAEVTDVNESGAIAMNRIFAASPGSGDPRAVFRMAPQRRWPFDEVGVDLDFLHAPDPAPRPPTPQPRPAGRMTAAPPPGAVAMGVTPLAWLAAVCGIAVAAGVTVGGDRRPRRPRRRRRRCRWWLVAGGAAAAGLCCGARSGRRATRTTRMRGGERWRGRRPGWPPGSVVWAITGWPVAGMAVAVVGVWSPWLLGLGPAGAGEQIDRLEALGAWCRRMADTLSGGGAVGLAQAITTSAGHAPDPIAVPVRRLAARLRAGEPTSSGVLAEFADEIDDRVADRVAAALALALHQQSGGVARVLRQLADGVARDVRARRDIEAERAEARQSMRMLLLIQAGVLGLLALVPGFAAPYRDPAGQLVMAMLLAGTLGAAGVDAPPRPRSPRTPLPQRHPMKPQVRSR